MKKTRFSEFEQNELYLLETLVSASAEKMNNKFDKNVDALLKEIQLQISINDSNLK
jgi:hypothetical protein